MLILSAEILKNNCERSKAPGDFSLDQKLDIYVKNLYTENEKNLRSDFSPRAK